MDKLKVLRNLQELIGKPFSSNEVIIAFEDFEEDGKTEVMVNKSENIGYDYVAYIESDNSTQFLFEVKNGIVKDVWIHISERSITHV